MKKNIKIGLTTKILPETKFKLLEDSSAEGLSMGQYLDKIMSNKKRR